MYVYHNEIQIWKVRALCLEFFYKNSKYREATRIVQRFTGCKVKYRIGDTLIKKGNQPEH